LECGGSTPLCHGVTLGTQLPRLASVAQMSVHFGRPFVGAGLPRPSRLHPGTQVAVPALKEKIIPANLAATDPGFLPQI